MLWWEKVEIKPGQTLAAQFRKKGAVELSGLILVGIGRGNAGRALSLSIYRLPSKPLGKAAGNKDDVYQKEEIVAFREEKRESVGGDELREREGENGRMGQGTGVVVVVTSK